MKYNRTRLKILTRATNREAREDREVGIVGSEWKEGGKKFVSPLSSLITWPACEVGGNKKSGRTTGRVIVFGLEYNLIAIDSARL